jgi:hypothetical protein
LCDGFAWLGFDDELLLFEVFEGELHVEVWLPTAVV